MRIIIGLFLWLFLTTAMAGTFTIKSQGFENNRKIPEVYTCDQGNLTPALSWSNPPAKTQSYTLTFISLDTPVGPLYNWVLFNIPKETTQLTEGMSLLPDGTVVGTNSFGETSYRGPCPPDSLVHRFVITIYALDTTLDLSGSNTDPDTILSQMKGHILDKAELKGVYSH